MYTSLVNPDRLTTCVTLCTRCPPTSNQLPDPDRCRMVQDPTNPCCAAPYCDFTNPTPVFPTPGTTPSVGGVNYFTNPPQSGTRQPGGLSVVVVVIVVSVLLVVVTVVLLNLLLLFVILSSLVVLVVVVVVFLPSPVRLHPNSCCHLRLATTAVCPHTHTHPLPRFLWVTPEQLLSSLLCGPRPPPPPPTNTHPRLSSLCSSPPPHKHTSSFCVCQGNTQTDVVILALCSIPQVSVAVRVTPKQLLSSCLVTPPPPRPPGFCGCQGNTQTAVVILPCNPPPPPPRFLWLCLSG